MFALVDCNNFYASCERVFQPKLRNQPIVVLSNNDGCIIARSNEAKDLGVPMGMPAYKCKELFESKNIHVFSSNYPLYGDMSARVMSLLREFSPAIEVYSIDEAFLKFDGLAADFDYTVYGLGMRKTVTQGTGLPISIGFAPTKSLAKIANKIAKKFPVQTGNVYTIDTEEKRVKALKWIAIDAVWGIGRQHAKRLKQLGITRAYQFCEMPQEWVLKNMSIVGLRLWKELNGIPCLDLDAPQDKKSIAVTRSFDKNYSELEMIKERVVTFAVTCAEKLRKQESCCNALLVFVHTNGHRKELPQYNRSVVVKLPFPTNSNIEIAKYAALGLDKIFKKGFQYKKAGVVVMDLTPEHSRQISIFENTNEKHGQIMKVMDKLNQAAGRSIIRLATQDKGRTWKMKQERLSPRYTTNIRDIIAVRA